MSGGEGGGHVVVLAAGVCMCVVFRGLAANTQRDVKGGSPSSLKIETWPKFEAQVDVFPPIRLTRLSMCTWINGAAGSGERR